MNFLIITIFFVLGLIVGSFLNVVIIRFNSGKNLNGRSICMSCVKTLTWLELIPVFSFLYQRGRCRHCQSHISIQYPLVEILTAIVFVSVGFSFLPAILSGVSFDLLAEIVWLLFGASLLIVIAGYDLRHKIIPDRLVLLLIVVSLFAPFLAYSDSTLYFVVNKILGGLLAGSLLYFFFWALWKYSDGRWMGLGDAKLVFAIGLFLGFQESLTAIILAFWFGSIVGLFLIAVSRITALSRYRRYFTIKSELPFAPFITFGALFQLIFQFNVFDYFRF